MSYPLSPKDDFYGWECEACNNLYEFNPEDTFFNPAQRTEFCVIGGYKVCEHCAEEFDEQFKGNDDYITDYIESK